MGDVIDRWRLNQGFNPYDNETQDMAIQSWVHILDREKVPAEVYNELFERSLTTRALAIQSGRDLPRMGAELLLAHWLGDNGLQKELRDKNKIGADKQLYSESYAPKCSWCVDTGKILTGPHRGLVCPHRD